MFKKEIFFKAAVYIFKCSFASGLIMFVCMAIGEFFINPQLFHGFLLKPKIWPFIFLESAIWMVPMSLLTLPLLWKLKNLKNYIVTTVIIGFWALLGIVAIVTYKLIYYPEGWFLEQATKVT